MPMCMSSVETGELDFLWRKYVSLPVQSAQLQYCCWLKSVYLLSEVNGRHVFLPSHMFVFVSKFPHRVSPNYSITLRCKFFLVRVCNLEVGQIFHVHLLRMFIPFSTEARH
jgi:hypothetical protein